jgi:uncharacterized protein
MITEFTPIAALAGGALIGLAAALLMLFSGRVAGISGILGGAFEAETGDRAWRLWFVAGLIAAPLLALVTGYSLPDVSMPSWPVVVIAALFTGFGTRLGNGCTSGHGVCGIARLSPRSIAATLAFMSAAIVTVFVVRHVIGG